MAPFFVVSYQSKRFLRSDASSSNEKSLGVEQVVAGAEQGDQIGRIFAYWVIVYVLRYF
jgi:hypothetical protein